MQTGKKTKRSVRLWVVCICSSLTIRRTRPNTFIIIQSGAQKNQARNNCNTIMEAPILPYRHKQRPEPLEKCIKNLHSLKNKNNEGSDIGQMASLTFSRKMVMVNLHSLPIKSKCGGQLSEVKRLIRDQSRKMVKDSSFLQRIQDTQRSGSQTET